MLSPTREGSEVAAHVYSKIALRSNIKTDSISASLPGTVDISLRQMRVRLAERDVYDHMDKGAVITSGFAKTSSISRLKVPVASRNNRAPPQTMNQDER